MKFVKKTRNNGGATSIDSEIFNARLNFILRGLKSKGKVPSKGTKSCASVYHNSICSCFFAVLRLDKMNPFVYCSKTRPSIGKASSASQPPNSRQNDINIQTAPIFLPLVAQRVSFATIFRDSKNKDLKVANVSRKKLV
jgi:hypothetical protein